MMGRKLGVGMASKVMAEVGNEFIAKEFGNMTKQNQIHVLADETLGGTLREYVETNSIAEVGDYIVTHFTECFSEGKAYEVIFENCGEIVVLDDEMEEHILSEENYRTLEPTDIVRLRDDNDIEQRFRLVDRKAEVGERVIVTSEGGGWYDDKIGEVFDVIDGEAYVRRTYEDLVSGDVYVESGRNRAGKCSFISYDNYLVLVPVESETSPKTTDDIIANLVRRVAQLERENKAMLDVYERGQKWTHERINGIKDDIETWAQDHSELAHKVARIADKQFNQGLDIGRIDDKIEMCIDDIVTLDERTEGDIVLCRSNIEVKERRCYGCRTC